MIDKYGLDIDVYAFTGKGKGNGESVDVVGNTIYLPCDDTDVSNKHFQLMRYAVENLQDYDIVLKTGNSTFVNLKNLADFCNSENYDMGKVYCTYSVELYISLDCETHSMYKSGFKYFPTGVFTLCSYDIFRTMCRDFESAHDYLACRYFEQIEYEGDNDKRMWRGIPEDCVCGYVMYYNGIPFEILYDRCVRVYSCGIWDSELWKMGNPFSLLALVCKTDAGYSERLEHEPKFIDLVCRFHEYADL